MTVKSYLLVTHLSKDFARDGPGWRVVAPMKCLRKDALTG